MSGGVKLTSRCSVCDRLVMPSLGWTCFHTPEEHAEAAVRRIMKKHGPALRSALSQGEQGDSRSHPSGVGPSGLTAGRNEAEVGGKG